MVIFRIPVTTKIQKKVAEKLFKCPTELDVLGWKTSVFEGTDWPTEKKMQVTLPGHGKGQTRNKKSLIYLICI